MCERCQASFSCPTTRTERRGQARDPFRIRVPRSGVERLGEPFDSASEVDPECTLEECPLYVGSPGPPDRFRLKVDRLGLLDDGAQLSLADRGEPDLLSAGDRMAQEAAKFQNAVMKAA